MRDIVSKLFVLIIMGFNAAGCTIDNTNPQPYYGNPQPRAAVPSYGPPSRPVIMPSYGPPPPPSTPVIAPAAMMNNGASYGPPSPRPVIVPNNNPSYGPPPPPPPAAVAPVAQNTAAPVPPAAPAVAPPAAAQGKNFHALALEKFKSKA